MTTITIDTKVMTPTVFVFATYGDFMKWIASGTLVNTPILDMQLAKSGTYQFTEYHAVTHPLNQTRWVYAHTFPTPQQHPTKQYTFTTWAVVANAWDDVLVSAIYGEPMNTITIDTNDTTPTVFLFATHSEFTWWIATDTEEGKSILALELARSGTYQFTERHTVTTMTGVRTVYSHTFPTPQQHPRKDLTYTTWAVLARDVDSAITEN